MPDGPNSPRRVKVAQRRGKALEMRRAGYRLDEIAAALGYRSRSAVSQDLSRALARIVDEPARDVLALELSRLDGLTRASWKQAAQGDLAAVDRVLRIMQRRARLLGLDYADRGAADTSDVDAWLSGMVPEPTEGDTDDDGAAAG